MPLETKVFEIRDTGTYIPVIATLMFSALPEESYHLERAGYWKESPTLVLITRITDNESQYSANNWSSFTMKYAHDHIQENFSKLKTGDVIDVRYIQGLTDTPVPSERRDPRSPR